MVECWILIRIHHYQYNFFGVVAAYASMHIDASALSSIRNKIDIRAYAVETYMTSKKFPL